MTSDKPLADMSASELVAVYNDELVDAKPISKWKGSKDVLIARIEVARREDRPKPVKKTKTEEVPGDVSKSRTIRAAALEHLCTVMYHEDKLEKSEAGNVVKASYRNARSVGIPYDEIIDKIRDEFPQAETTVACLRWYAVKVRVEDFGYEGLTLPQRRPRARSMAK